MSNISITVDVDTLRHYANFAPDGKVQADPLMEHTLPRMLELLERLDVRATFFVVGNTVRDHEGFWRRAAEAGHELASHSQTHTQGIHCLTREQKREELYRSKCVIEDLASAPVVGFRAPAYNIDWFMLATLAELGYQYDSSFFPGWYVALSKVATRLLSRHYRPTPTSPFYRWHWRLPRQPFQWRFSSGTLAEFPIPTTRFCKPYFGTIHLNTSPRFFRSETDWLARRAVVISYELHPIEVIDACVLEKTPWVRNIPGVGKHEDPWAFLSMRLEYLKRLGPIRLLRELTGYAEQSVPARAA